MHSCAWSLRPSPRSRLASAVAAACFLAGTLAFAEETLQDPPEPAELADEAAVRSSPTRPDVPTAFAAAVVESKTQPQPPILPNPSLEPEIPLPPAARARFSGVSAMPRSTMQARPATTRNRPGTNVVFGAESKVRVTTDTGNLLRKSPWAMGVGTQLRNPIVTDARARGGRVGRLASSGSHWVPARIDLDTMMNKIDSRIVSDVLVVKGPYTVLYGPDFAFYDVQLLPAPRYADGFESHGSSSFDFKSNGEQWYGRQSFWGGDEDWGFRVGYGHRTGSDYTTGEGTPVPGSYNSREFDAAIGWNPSSDSSIDFHYLRLDQTDVEFPGQAFDIDYLVTDGFELEYVLRDQPHFDELSFDTWYNRTRFDGSAQRVAKRQQFPFLDFIRYRGFTDVDSTSTGFRLMTRWGHEDRSNLTAGVDLRFIRQELNEIASGRIGFNIFRDANSPIPKSESANPGFFLEQAAPLNDQFTVRCGLRADTVSTDVVDNPQKLAQLGLQNPQSSLADILGTDQFEQSFSLWSAHITGEYELSPCCTLLGGFGYAERPPTLTELYAAQSFMFLLQNGLNTVTGDPKLRPERLYQFDVGARLEYPRFRAEATGFFAWARDYITFENLRVFRGPPFGQVEQVSLGYVNTELASFTGVELHMEYDLEDWLTPFATMSYVEGRDHTRNGSFATQRNTPGNPSTQVPGLPRGFFSGVAGPGVEPLPSILPLESRIGLQIHDVRAEPAWGVELSVRIVDDQSRVAASLLETPTPGFAVWDVRGYWYASQNVLVVAGFENFTDRSYREHLDFRSENGVEVLQPGVNFYVGTEVTY